MSNEVMMMTETQPVNEGTAYRKAQLLQDALQTLQAAHGLDERDDLDAANFLEWYDRTIPDVRDIKILAGAMEIEMARRRGERVALEGERRGGDTKVTQCVTLLSEASRKQRSRDRLVAEHPDVVQTYVQREVKAGRIPTVRHAIGVASAARATAAPQRIAKQVAATQARQSEFDEQAFAAITKVADGTRRTDDQVGKVIGYQTPSFLQRIRLIPWLRIDRTPEGLMFQIDEPLRAICEGRLPRPTLSYQSTDQFLRNLRAEITRRRKENHDEFLKRRWNSELILKREQTSLLDWIEQELDRVPSV